MNLKSIHIDFCILSRFCIALLLLTINFSIADAKSTGPVVLEITGNMGNTLDDRSLVDICMQNHIPTTDIYQWKNHLVVYGNLMRVDEIKRQIAVRYPNCLIKLYNRPFYNFNRKQRCGKAGLVTQWDNILLTANLVNNVKLQQEYLNYHATQFQKWPEVSQGFCNAGFRQLLVFKKGRQLILVISIPKGASLDLLNPLTTKDNPRVNDWNTIMKKYQEGIPGTKPGEVWVFLKPVPINKIKS